ncbi:hypothetical protein SAMN02982929_00152 [Saccharopolyspora kobensis]|uniref:Uncharacterized protein n=1 Tax=Saccharopolyspora kobensis TaxID=146035 RepID=A0A1H5TA39_9PSEU|nr:hypothetical protein SAMN02982929_00152 [Saccharopolyspora kobensis]SFC49141.1 hypothetical protein SAMN05216506_101880 [Saccharopolyspora kobensis]
MWTLLLVEAVIAFGLATWAAAWAQRTRAGGRGCSAVPNAHDERLRAR